METKYFENGFVGKKVTDANEAIKLFNAGMDIRAQNGCDFLWWNDDDSEPSSSEIVSRIISYIKEHGYVYAGFELANEKVVPVKSTQLNCDFYKGQTVYFLRQGKIYHGEVLSIQLATDDKFEKSIYYQLNRLRGCAESMINDKSAINFIDYVDDAKDTINANCVFVKTCESSGIFMSLGKVFATKEALIENLLSNAK